MASLEKLLLSGHPFGAAARTVSRDKPFSAPTLKRWYYKAKRYRPADRAAALIPGWSGGKRKKKIPAQAWDWFASYYLTRAQPTLAESYRRSVEAAAAKGWGELPSERTFANRLKSDVSHATRVYLREGAEALAKLYPSQRRDKTAFRAGEAVTGDGLKFDRLWDPVARRGNPQHHDRLVLGGHPDRLHRRLATRQDRDRRPVPPGDLRPDGPFQAETRLGGQHDGRGRQVDDGRRKGKAPREGQGGRSDRAAPTDRHRGPIHRSK